MRVCSPLALLILLSGCRGCGPAATTPTTLSAPKTTSSRPAATEAASTVKVYGLTLGATDPAGITAWITAHGLNCKAEASPRRATQRYECGKDAGLKPDTLPERPALNGGQLTQILLSHGDDVPLTHISVTRQFSLPADAVTDYSTALASLTSTYGAPARASGPPDAAKFSGPMAHWSADWRFTNIEVHLSILKAGGSFISVNERYDVPGASDAEGVRGPEKLEPTPGGDPFGFDKIPGLKKPSWHQ
jgi:hypothetical protein